MKQKIVIKVFMHCQKCHTKAMTVAVSIPGVEKVEIAGEDKDHVVVIGDGIDSVELTRRLRKKVAHAELVSVGEAKNEEESDDKPNKKSEEDDNDEYQPPPWGYLPPPPPPPYYSYYVVKETASDPMLCIIL